MNGLQGGPLAGLLAVVLAGTLIACTPAEGPGQVVEDPDRISVSAEVDDPIVEVQMGDLRPGEPGTVNYSVEVTWRGDGTAVLDDARFTHHAEGADGDLVLSGRGCGATWDEGQDGVFFECTADLQEVRLSNGSSHSYPVRIHTAVGPLRLTPGTYVAEETIGWTMGGESGEFTVTLTVVVD